MTRDNDHYQELENELRGFRPSELSDRLRHGLEKELNESKSLVDLPAKVNGDFLRRSFLVLAMALTVYLCGLFVWVLWPDESGGEVARKRSPQTRKAALPNNTQVELVASRPSLLTYGRAYNSSEVDLDDLLDEHANRLLPNGEGLWSVQQRTH